MSFSFNMICMLVIIYGLNILGQIVNNKHLGSKFKYPVIIGFMTFFASFQILAFPFILIQSKFSSFLLFLFSYFVFMAIYTLANKSYFVWKVNFKEHKILIGLIISWFILIATRSLVYSDSWLYSTMVTSTLENNLIYSNNGFMSNTTLNIMHHRFESYYLWQAFVGLVFTGNYLMALVTEYKILDAVLTMSVIFEIGHHFKMSKARSGMLAIFMISMMVVSDFMMDASFFQTTEPPVQLFQMSTGTAMYHYLMIPLMIIYLRIEETMSNREKGYFLTLFVLLFSSLTTTFYYVLPLYLFTVIIIKHFVLKQKDAPIVWAFVLEWSIVFISFTGVFIDNYLIVALIAILLMICNLIIVRLYSKISLKAGNRIIAGITGLYLVLSVLSFSLIDYTSIATSRDRTTTEFSNIIGFYQSGEYLTAIMATLMLPLMVYVIFKIVNEYGKYRKFGLYILIYLGLFFNPISFTIYDIIGIGPVTSRIAAASLIGYIVSIYLIETLDKRNIIIKVILFVYCMISIALVTSEWFGHVPQKISDYNAFSGNLGQLAEYEYLDDSFFVVDNLDATDGSENFYRGINKLVILRPDLSYSPDITSCEQLYQDAELSAKYSHCYTIYKKNTAPDLEYIYETDGYYLYNNF